MLATSWAVLCWLLIWVALLQHPGSGRLVCAGDDLRHCDFLRLRTHPFLPSCRLAAGEWFGFFYLNTWVPALLLLAGVIMHIAYGITLMICLKFAGVKGLDSC